MASDHSIDETFPQSTGFGMSLKRVLDRENHGTVDGDTKTSCIPIGVLVVDANECRLLRRRGVGVGVGRINFQTNETFLSAQSKEHSHAGLLNT